MLSNENWATKSPESRLFKGKNLFRWDDSPGLEHHCGTCATPLHNARAKTSCIGKHVEPCYRFHQQLHFVGKSQECFGCNSADEMHHKRHKEILQMVRKLTEFDTQDGTFTVARRTLDPGRNPREGSNTTTGTSPAHAGSGSVCSDNDRSTKARKKARISLEATLTASREIEVFPRADLDFISYALHKMVLESKAACAGSYSYSNPNLTTTKLNDSILEGRPKNAGVDEVLEEAKDEVGILTVKTPKVANIKTHKKKTLDEKQLQEMTPRQRKVQNFMNSRGGNSRKFDPERIIKSDLYGGVDPEIFFCLGIEVVEPPVNSRERKALVAKLVGAVKEDLDIQEREESECQMREEGFWRWAGKTAFNHMSRTREGIDWATGTKIEGLKAAGLAKDGKGDKDTFQNNGGSKEFELESDVTATPTPVTTAVFPSHSGNTTTPPNEPVKFKCYAPTLRVVNTDKATLTPCKKPSKKGSAKVSFDDKVFTQASCPRGNGKPILYSKPVTAIPSFFDYTTDFAAVSGNQPAESFTQKENVNDDQGWATVGKGGKSVPIVTAKSKTKVATKSTTSANATETKSSKRKKT